MKLIVLLLTLILAHGHIKGMETQQFKRSDIVSMSVKNLRTMLTERGLDCSGCIEKNDFVLVLIAHLEENNQLVADFMDSGAGVGASSMDSNLKSCCANCVDSQSRILTLEGQVKSLENTVQKLKTVVNKLVNHANAQQESGGEPQSSAKVDMTQGNMVNGKFYPGSTYTDKTGNNIYGVGNNVMGTGNQVRGRNNQVSGSNNQIGGSGLNIHGNGNIMNVG